MKYQTLALRCECGAPTTRIREVGFTADHQLILHWLCPRCKRHVYAVKPLSACWRDCPTQQDFDEAPDADTTTSADTDVTFLRAVGIAWPERDSNEPKFLPQPSPKP